MNRLTSILVRVLCVLCVLCGSPSFAVSARDGMAPAYLYNTPIDETLSTADAVLSYALPAALLILGCICLYHIFRSRPFHAYHQYHRRPRRYRRRRILSWGLALVGCALLFTIIAFLVR